MKTRASVKLAELKDKEAKYAQKLIEERLKIGKADTAMESAHPSGRFELEQGIVVLEVTLSQIKAEIADLENKFKKPNSKKV